MSIQPSGDRLDALDSLRGLAAATVVLHHCLITLPLLYGAYFPEFLAAFTRRHVGFDDASLAYLLTYTPLHLLWGGHEAVMLFFVLSGFVLALPFLAGRQPGMPTFLLKRLIRLYPPYVASIGFAFGMYALLHGDHLPGTSAWFGSLWHEPLTAKAVRDHLQMSGDLNRFNSVIWSLVPEIHISLVFPLLMVAVMRLPAMVTLGLSFFLASESFRNWVWYAVPGNGQAKMMLWAFVTSLGFLPLFTAGALLARHKGRASALLDRMGSSGRVGLGVAALYLLNIRWELPFFFDKADLVIGSGALLLIALCVHRAPAWLKHPRLVWLGQRSFSLYLVHEVVLLSLVNGLHPRLPLWPLLLTMPVVAILVADGFYRLVERPAMTLSRRLTRTRAATDDARP